MLSESSLIDMNPSTSDNSYGHHVESPSNFFKCMYDTDLFPESSNCPTSANGGGGGGSALSNGNMISANGNGGHCFGASKLNGQSAANDQSYGKLISQADVVGGCLQSPVNGGHFSFNGVPPSYGYQQTNAMISGAVPASPGYSNAASAAGPFGSPGSAGAAANTLFSPNPPMPDSTTNFLQQQQSSYSAAKQTVLGFERRSIDSSMYGDGAKTPLSGAHDSYYQPMRAGSVSGDFAFSRFSGETSKHGKTVNAADEPE